MRILHVAAQDVGGGGGAFDAAYRLHRNMRAAGTESVMLVLRKRSEDSDVIDFSVQLSVVDRLRWVWKRLMGRFHRMRYRASPYFQVEFGDFFPIRRLRSALPFVPDAIIVHWVAGFMTAKMMRLLSQQTGARVYWYMLDMAPLTGGCHYAFGCVGYKDECSKCPQLSEGSDQAHQQLRNKAMNLHSIDVVAVVPTTWLERQAKDSIIFGKRQIRKIMLGLDVDIFRPVPKEMSRSVLGLPANRKIIFFGAHNIDEPRKGIGYLIEALKILHASLAECPKLRDNILVVTAGMGVGVRSVEVPFEYRHIGVLRGDVMLAAAYQAADVFVSASTEDSGPMMINESVLCGTPVVAFDMGVAPDLVHTGRTGYRARLKDPTDLAIGLRRVLDMDDNSAQAMARECRAVGMQSCHSDVQVRAFIELCGVR